MNAIIEQTPQEKIEEGCRWYASARTLLRGMVADLQAQIVQLVDVKRPELIAALDDVANARTALAADVDAHPELFQKPRTRQHMGVKIGYRKLPGKVECDDEERTIELIRTQLPTHVPVLIETVYRLRRNAVSELSAKELASIACRITETGDEVVVKAVDTELDKLVKMLANDATMGDDLVGKMGVL